MREIGISVYPNFYPLDQIKDYLEKAHSFGFKKVFVSLILTNHGFEGAQVVNANTWNDILSYCKELGMTVSADMNDEVFNELGCALNDLTALQKMGITKLRIDGGFTSEEIALLSKNTQGIQIEVNASMSSSDNQNGNALRECLEFLETIEKEGNIGQLTACHNFFPLPDTALSLEDIRPINDLFASFGVPVGGFVASQLSPKDLHHLGHGVCTIEKHRFLPCHIAMLELFANGFDDVLIGDSSADLSELAEMERCYKQDYIEIPVVFNPFVPQNTKLKIQESILISRVDQPANLIRATDTRGMEVPPCYCAPREKYTISVLNYRSAQYEGELQISLKDLGQSVEHNVIGFVHPFAKDLLPYLLAGRNKFRLVEYK
ncbi:MupG family TIM beta-alpha barrel fold protein [Neobacillus sp. YX16]|uniref:MupG family TIM beta-alpha barrel fold protein n=1 Tax=Neobacillus sp. YX16 TaxID=3047874 RepID=UPI0024C435E8|nr:MupG family TIM beta-alpha barrel fold protein [Neobacillus sp. YX16]WHZ05015.1 MupG family TIM beta-alpha barrel fold protein [Neobacillus sp. YX16]